MSAEKQRLYAELAQQLAALIDGEADPVANAANMAALIYHGLPELNWAGSYFAKGGDERVLGPVQGKLGRVRIAWGQCVCVTASGRRGTILVPTLHDFPGHIPCDPT